MTEVTTNNIQVVKPCPTCGKCPTCGNVQPTYPTYPTWPYGQFLPYPWYPVAQHTWSPGTTYITHSPETICGNRC